MKRVYLAIIIITILAISSGCFLFKAKFVENENLLAVLKNGTLEITSRGTFSGIEISLQGNILEDSIVIPSGFMKIVFHKQGRTIIAITNPDRDTIPGELLAKISGEFKTIPDIRIEYVTLLEKRQAICSAIAPLPDGISIIDTRIESNSNGFFLIHAKTLSDVSGSEMIVTYDTSKISIDTTQGNDGVEALNTYASGMLIVQHEVASVKISTAFSGAGKDILDEDIYRVYVNTLEKGVTDLQINGEVRDYNAQLVGVAFTGGSIEIGEPKLLGDFDESGNVDLVDFINFARNYGSAVGDGKYNQLYDIAPAEDQYGGDWAGIYDKCEPDGKVDLLDFIIFARNYGKRKPENQPPFEPTNPTPTNGAMEVSLKPNLSWECADPDGDSLVYDVYFGTEETPGLVSSNQGGNTYEPGELSPGTKYYWKVDAKDSKGGETEGSVWSFTTGSVSSIQVVSTEADSSSITIEYLATSMLFEESYVEIRRSLDNSVFSKLLVLTCDATNFLDINVLPDTTYYYHLLLFTNDELVDEDTASETTNPAEQVSYETYLLTGRVQLPEGVDPTLLVVRNMGLASPLIAQGSFNLETKSDQTSLVLCEIPGYPVPLMSLTMSGESELQESKEGYVIQAGEMVIDYLSTAKAILGLNPLLATPFPESSQKVMEAIDACSLVQVLAELIERYNEGETELYGEIEETLEESLGEILAYLEQKYPFEEQQEANTASINFESSNEEEAFELFVHSVDQDEIKIDIQRVIIDNKPYWKLVPTVSSGWISANFVTMFSGISEDLSYEMMESFEHTQALLPHLLGAPKFNFLPCSSYFKHLNFIGSLISLAVDSIFDSLFESQSLEYYIPADEEANYSFSAYGGVADFSEILIFQNELWSLISHVKHGGSITPATLPNELLSVVGMCYANAIDIAFMALSVLVDVSEISSDFVPGLLERIPIVFERSIRDSGFNSLESLSSLMNWVSFISSFFRNTAVEVTKYASEFLLNKGAVKAITKLVLLCGKEVFSWATVVPKVLCIASNAVEFCARVASMSYAVSRRELTFVCSQKQKGVWFEDPILEQYIRELIGKLDGPIFKEDLLIVDEISAPALGIRSLKGVEHCTNLFHLDVSGNSLSSYKIDLVDLPNLYWVNLDNNPLVSLSLSNLPALNFLSVANCSVSTLELVNLPSLSYLFAEENNISTLELVDLPSLYMVNLDYNPIYSLSLRNLPALYSLYASCCYIQTLELVDLPSLSIVDLYYNTLPSVDVFSCLPSLSELILSHNVISDVTPLLTSSLGAGDYLEIFDSLLIFSSYYMTYDMQILSKLVQRGVDVRCGHSLIPMDPD